MTLQQGAEKVVVTFIEAAGAYLVVIPTVNWSKAAIAGAVGAGVSAVYNFIRESQPTTPTPVVVAPNVSPNPVDVPAVPKVV